MKIWLILVIICGLSYLAFMTISDLKIEQLRNDVKSLTIKNAQTKNEFDRSLKEERKQLVDFKDALKIIMPDRKATIELIYVATTQPSATQSATTRPIQTKNSTKS